MIHGLVALDIKSNDSPVHDPQPNPERNQPRVSDPYLLTLMFLNRPLAWMHFSWDDISAAECQTRGQRAQKLLSEMPPQVIDRWHRACVSMSAFLTTVSARELDEKAHRCNRHMLYARRCARGRGALWRPRQWWNRPPQRTSKGA